MRLRLKYSASFGPRQYLLAGVGIPCAFFATVMLVLLLLPLPHTRLHYLIAGTTPTGIGLVAAMAWIERKRFRPRKGAIRRVAAGDPERQA